MNEKNKLQIFSFGGVKNKTNNEQKKYRANILILTGEKKKTKIEDFDFEKKESANKKGDFELGKN